MLKAIFPEKKPLDILAQFSCFFPFFIFCAKKVKSIIRPAFEVRSTQMLVEIYNTQIPSLDFEWMKVSLGSRTVEGNTSWMTACQTRSWKLQW